MKAIPVLRLGFFCLSLAVFHWASPRARSSHLRRQARDFWLVAIIDDMMVWQPRRCSSFSFTHGTTENYSAPARYAAIVSAREERR